MAVRIFDVDNKQVVINENCLLIPELKAIHEQYEDPIPVFSFLYFMTDPSSPYGNIEESAKEDVIIEDYPGEYTTEDVAVIAALEKLRKLYQTPTSRIFLAAKKNLENLADYLASTAIDSGRDGNLGDIYRVQVGLPKLMAGFKDLEKMKDEEDIQARGNATISYDEF